MAKKRRGRFTLFFVFVFGTVLIWSVAFLAWLFWSDIEALVRGQKRSSEQGRKPSQERIFEEDRKKLEEILKEK